LEDLIQEKKYEEIAQTLAVRKIAQSYFVPEANRCPHRPSNKYPLPLNLIHQSSASLRSGNEFKKFKAGFAHNSMPILTNCM
jgi:hypothetical protein